jgi:hypothetical protein
MSIYDEDPETGTPREQPVLAPVADEQKARVREIITTLRYAAGNLANLAAEVNRSRLTDSEAAEVLDAITDGLAALRHVLVPDGEEQTVRSDVPAEKIPSLRDRVEGAVSSMIDYGDGAVTEAVMRVLEGKKT